MAIAVKVDDSQIPNPTDKTMQSFIVDLVLTLSGTYATNGDTLDLSTVSPSNALPRRVDIFEATPAPGPASGYAFIFLPGTNLTNGLVEIFNGTTQLTTGAYGTPPFSITGFKLRARAWFEVFI